MVSGLLQSADRSKRFTTLVTRSPLHTHMQCCGSVAVQYLARGCFDMQPGNRTSYLPITERPAELQHIGNFNLQCNGADRQQKQPFVDVPACHICNYFSYFYSHLYIF